MESERFTDRYIELEELGNGRFAKVCRAREKGSVREVALKQISRVRQRVSLTRAEYDFLRATRHDNIVKALALFEDLPQPGVDTIVSESWTFTLLGRFH